MLAIDNLSASYGPLMALSGITLNLAPAARVGIFGHNGAGKTTLLKCIVGAHAPSAGSVTFEEHRSLRETSRPRCARASPTCPRATTSFRICR